MKEKFEKRVYFAKELLMHKNNTIVYCGYKLSREWENTFANQREVQHDAVRSYYEFSDITRRFRYAIFI
ncbi:hypothetical protein DA68_11380 [Bacillus cereus]|nr:hypothetical protein DA68_11380 [Bacillus cereus]PEW70041.1 hypothetical protein CN448_11395 [Bacillus cereus]